MSTAILQIDIDAAQRRAERIRFHATNANDAMQSLQKLVHTARELEDHLTLGYPSWTAYVREIFGDEPLRLARDVRRELVAELAEAGMSTRAIAPIVGVTRQMVSKDLAAGGNLVATSPDPAETLAPIPATFEVDGMTVTSRGEVIDPQPETTEHTFTEKVKTVTGLDGKTYTTKPREPKPVAQGDEADRLNAIQASKAIGGALETLLGLTYPGYRKGIINDWWPIGKNDVPPAQSELFAPSQLRQIAQGLITTANEMEAHRV